MVDNQVKIITLCLQKMRLCHNLSKITISSSSTFKELFEIFASLEKDFESIAEMSGLSKTKIKKVLAIIDDKD